MDKDVVKYSKRYFATTQINCDYSFKFMKSEAAVSENFRKFTMKIPVVESLF